MISNEQLSSFEKARVKVVIPIILSTILGIGCFVVGVYLTIGLENIIGFALFVPLGIIACALAGYNIFIFKKKAQKILVPILLQDSYSNGEYDSEGKIPLSEINKCNFFAKCNNLVTKNKISCNYKNIHIESCYFYMEAKSKNNNSNSAFIKGRFYIFDFKREFNEIVKICEKDINSSTNLDGGMQKIETEYIDFNKKFNVWSSDPSTCMYVLTPQMQIALLDIENSLKGHFFFTFKDGNLYIAVQDCDTYLPISIFKRIDENTIKELIYDIELPKLIIDSMNLDSEKFNSKKAYRK